MKKELEVLMAFDVNKKNYSFFRKKGFSGDSFRMHEIRIYKNLLEPIYQQKSHGRDVLANVMPLAISNLAKYFRSVEETNDEYDSKKISCILHDETYNDLDYIDAHISDLPILGRGINLAMEFVFHTMMIQDIPINLSTFTQTVEIMRYPIHKQLENFSILKESVRLSDE